MHKGSRWSMKPVGAGCSLGCGRRPWASFCSAPSNVPTASAAFLELPRPSRPRVFMPLCLSSCSGVWIFTRLLLLGQAEATIEIIKIWITSNSPVTNMVKNVIYWHQFIARANQEWHKGLMGLTNKKYPITPHLSALGIALHGCMHYKTHCITLFLTKPPHSVGSTPTSTPKPSPGPAASDVQLNVHPRCKMKVRTPAGCFYLSPRPVSSHLCRPRRPAPVLPSHRGGQLNSALVLC